MKPLQQAKNRIASNRPKRMLGRRSSDGGSNGQAWRRSWRNSVRHSQASSGTAAANSRAQGQDQCSDGPRASGSSRQRISAASSRVPGASTRAACSARVSGTQRRLQRRMPRQIGRLIRNTLRQPRPPMSAETRKPPSTWPTTKARPPMAP
ncbi:Uncharacterised protein [Klebsiella pneumoniae]|nr:Uncharacterised protein [Klebsiella pneumoniae]